MSLTLGIRMALAGGRESLARMALMALGLAVGVMLLLLTLTALPIMQSHVDRLAWHRTTEASPATAPDPALWLAVTDRYAGHDVIRVNVAALGPRPPVPPGVEKLPGPGEVVVSPALAELMRSIPADQLRDRFPGRVIGTIGDDGLIAPSELVGIVGRTPEEMRKTYGALEIRGIEQPGEPLDVKALWQLVFTLIAVLIVGPVVVFVSMVTRIGGARRERRFAAIRLAGATRWQTALLAATETAMAALTATLAGFLGYQAIRPLVAHYVTLGHGMPIFVADVAAPVGQALAVLVAVPALAVATTLVALRPVQISPLGTRHPVPRRPPRVWRLIPLAAGVLGLWYLVRLDNNPLLSVAAPMSILVGLVLSGPWVCQWASRAMARLSRNATTLIVARRIAADPYSAFRSVSGAALAMFVATVLGMVAAGERVSASDVESVLRQGVVAVHVEGAPEESLAPLISDGVVVARRGPGLRIIVDCADLKRVANVRCPLPWWSYDGKSTGDLFVVPQRLAPRGFAVPDTDSSAPVQTLFIPTDGTQAAEERVRTLAANVAPGARTHTNRDLAAQAIQRLATWDTALPPAMVFVLLVAACSLTVSTVTGLIERRRPFALLRASGMRLGELRRMVLLETVVPLGVTVAGGVGVAMLIVYLLVSPTQWVLPSGGFFIGLGAGVLAALAVSAIALPLMDVATRHDSVRFE